MEQTCQQCKNSCCSEESVVVCEGFCEGIRRFHATCVGLSKEEADVCLFRNILWMCDDCRDLMENVHFRSYIKSTKPLETPIESIELEVAKVNVMLNRLNETIDSLRNAPISALNVSSPSPPEDVQPLSSTKIISNSSIAEQHETRTTPNETFKLYLSNIATDVTEEEIERMVNEVLCVDEIHAISCLKPTWRDVSRMDFISFKVEVDEKYRTKALNSTNWPKGIRYREFKDYAATSWRPTR